MQTVKRRYREVKSKFQELTALSKALPEFFRARVAVQQAEDEIKRALDRRHESFLELVLAQIYERPNSPYRRLLDSAGCDFSDLETQVRRYGLEATLEKLAGAGVYVTSDEFKGKKEIVRGGRSFRVSPDDFDMSESAAGFTIRSSGTSNRPISSRRSVDELATATFALCILYSAHNLFSHAHAVYDAILPASGGLNNLMTSAKMGIAIDRWFARKNPIHNRLEHAYYFLTTYWVVLLGKWFGPGFPRPEFLDAEDLRPIVSWALEQQGKGKACCIRTTASNAAKIARAAFEMETGLERTKFVVSGEPFTESKYEIIKRVGAGAIPRYSFTGGGNVGLGCAKPLHTDEVHINEHRLALISHPRPVVADGPPIHPLLSTTLHSLAPRFLLNVENGDYATRERRDCGCALGEVGLTLHLHHIRSFEKFTSEGMNYFYGDLFELLEKLLPSEFGGGPGDYQLVEEEDSNGQTRLTLVVHPQVGNVEEEKLLSRLREGLGRGSRSNQFQTKIWQAAGTIRLRRAVPHASPRGKILPLHIPR
jgi:hypothetical protein